MITPKENLEMLKEVADNGYEATRQLGEINLNTWNKIVEKQIDMFGVWLGAGVKQIELSTTVKDPKEYLESQVALAREVGEKLIAGGREAISTGSEAQGEYRAWYEKSVASMTNNWNTVGTQAS